MREADIQKSDSVSKARKRSLKNDARTIEIRVNLKTLAQIECNYKDILNCKFAGNILGSQKFTDDKGEGTFEKKKFGRHIPKQHNIQ